MAKTLNNKSKSHHFNIDLTIALHILHNSISNLRANLLLLLRRAVSFLHPRNAQGFLAAMLLVTFLLRRAAKLPSTARSAYRREFWRNMMRAAVTYEEWAHAARMIERGNGASNCDLYDEEIVRDKLRELRRRREEGSLRDVVYCMRADLIRNLGDMCNPLLHKGRLQVYFCELEELLDYFDLI